MNSEQRNEAVLELLEGKASASELAQRHGVAEAELLVWRDAWLAGARAGRANVRRPSFKVLGTVVAVALVALVSREAYAASCAAPSLFNNLGLKYFCADDPALADDVNQNTSQLVSLIQQKIGASWGLPDAGSSTVGITTPAATVSGSANTLNVTSTSINSSATLNLQSSGGTTTMGGALNVTGQVTAPNTWVRIYDSDVALTPAAPVTFSIPVYANYKILYRGKMTTTADSRLLLRVGASTSSIGSAYRSYMSLEGAASATEFDATGIYLNRTTSNHEGFLTGEVDVYVASDGPARAVIARGDGASWDYTVSPTSIFGTRSEGSVATAILTNFQAMQFAVTAANSQWSGHILIYAIPSTP
jgi:transposase-like protein